MVSDALKRQKEEAAPPPTREEYKGAQDSIEFQLGYRLGYHHCADDMIEIAEDEEEISD